MLQRFCLLNIEAVLLKVTVRLSAHKPWMLHVVQGKSLPFYKTIIQFNNPFLCIINISTGSTLNFSDITSKFCTVAMFVIVNI
jgi:hypothetical protein